MYAEEGSPITWQGGEVEKARYNNYSDMTLFQRYEIGGGLAPVIPKSHFSDSLAQFKSVIISI